VRRAALLVVFLTAAGARAESFHGPAMKDCGGVRNDNALLLPPIHSCYSFCFDSLVLHFASEFLWLETV
jgi:hypothetical protein